MPATCQCRVALGFHHIAATASTRMQQPRLLPPVASDLGAAPGIVVTRAAAKICAGLRPRGLATFATRGKQKHGWHPIFLAPLHMPGGQ